MSTHQRLINCRTNFLGTLRCTGEEGRPYVAGCTEADLLEGMTLIQPANESAVESTDATFADSYDNSTNHTALGPPVTGSIPDPTTTIDTPGRD